MHLAVSAGLGFRLPHVMQEPRGVGDRPCFYRCGGRGRAWWFISFVIVYWNDLEYLPL